MPTTGEHHDTPPGNTPRASVEARFLANYALNLAAVRDVIATIGRNCDALRDDDRAIAFARAAKASRELGDCAHEAARLFEEISGLRRHAPPFTGPLNTKQQEPAMHWNWNRFFNILAVVGAAVATAGTSGLIAIPAVVVGVASLVTGVAAKLSASPVDLRTERAKASDGY